MNWYTIANTYPKAFAEFTGWLTHHYPAFTVFEIRGDDYENYLAMSTAPHPETLFVEAEEVENRNLYDFFDAWEIYCTVNILPEYGDFIGQVQSPTDYRHTSPKENRIEAESLMYSQAFNQLELSLKEQVTTLKSN
jgi:hypothetical protein